MGYDTYYYGDLTIEPPLPTTAIDSWNAKNEEENIFILRHIDGEETVGVRDGEIVVIGNPGHTEAGMRWGDSVRTDSATAEQHAREVVALCQKYDAIANGIINAQGEEHGDIWRIRVEKNEVHVECPKLLWPNGDETTP